ncbi:MAG: molybdopterin-guanine dinucleotide biosynthesis protein B [Actinomycetota bacterium]|nr:molybdopterin-guanine dinucleotide biosynthesis protein B [Actinomycetota bacterium]
MKPKVVIVIGKSNSGKTTLIEGLIPELTKKGYRVATVKRARHGFEIDKPGKDSHKHARAGASAVLVVSDDRLALIKELEGEPPLGDLIEAHFEAFDLVIVEGFKEEGYSKILVLRGLEGEEEFLRLSSILALVSDEAKDFGSKRFRSSQAVEVAAFIEKEIIAAK